MIQTTLQSIRQLSQLQAIKWDVTTFNKLVPTPVKFYEGIKLEANTIGELKRASTDGDVRVENLPSSAQLGKTLTFRIVSELVDERSQSRRKVHLSMKPKVLVKYGMSIKLNTVSLAQRSDGIYELTMRPVCDGEHTIEVKYDDKPAKYSPFNLKVSGAPKKGDCVTKGPHWSQSLQVKEGIVQSQKATSSQRFPYNTTTTLSIKWDDVKDVREYTWEKHEIELVL